MKITRNDIIEFSVLYKEYFNVMLTKEQAREKLSLLVEQMSHVYQPITLEQLNVERLLCGKVAIDYDPANEL